MSYNRIASCDSGGVASPIASAGRARADSAMPLSLAEIFPMSLQGAVFLMAMGAAILMGAVWRSARDALVAIGLAAGLSSFFFTWPLAAPYAPPTPLMWVSLILAIVAQVAALVWAIPHFAPRGKR